MISRIANFWVCLSLMALFFCVQPVLAQENRQSGFSVDRKLINLEIDPGKERIFSVGLKSLSKEPQVISVDTRDFWVKDDGEVEIRDESNPINGMAGWVEVSQSKWSVNSGEEVVKNFKVKVPDDAIVGSHWTFLVFRASPVVDGDNFKKPIVSAEIGVYILVTVKGDIVAKGEFENFFAPRIVSDQTDFRLEYRNIGNVHYIPQGQVLVTDILTGEESVNRIEEHVVFPGKAYTFVQNWQPPSVFGIYRAKAAFQDGEKNQFSRERIIFGKYSFVLLAGSVLAVILIFVVSFRLKRRYKR